MHGVQVRSLVRELRSHMSCIQSLDQSIKLISIRKCWECVAALAVPPTTRAPRRLHVPSLARGGDGLGDVSLPASQWHITVSELSSSAPRILREKDLLYDLLSGRLLSVSLRWASLQLRESACLLRKKNGLLGDNIWSLLAFCQRAALFRAAGFAVSELRHSVYVQIHKLGVIITWLPWRLSGKESSCHCRRHGFEPWVWKIPWRRKWQPTPVFLPGKSHWQRSLVGYSPWGCKSLDTT